MVELGMNHPGEIRSLVEIAEPEVRVWTNVAPVHSAFFESVEAIADAKAEILEGATSATLLIANASDLRVMARTSKFPGDIATFGIETDAEVSATSVKSLGLKGMTAKMHTPVGSVDVRTSLLGEGNVANVLAAVSIALRFQVPLDVVLAGVTNFIAQAKRGNIVHVNGITVVDDTYNSNPVALKQVLQTLSFETGCGRRVAILGEMLELGEHAISLHESCGRAAVESGFDRIIAVGGISAQALADGAMAAGLLATSVTVLPTSQEAAQKISQIVQKKDLVLVKGSRGIRMDQIVDRLKAELGN